MEINREILSWLLWELLLLAALCLLREKLLVAYLRQANQDGATHAAAILKLLVERLRKAWPHVRIIVRADSGFCRQTLLNWCDRKNVYYCIGIARNKVLEKRLSPLLALAKEQFESTKQKQRFFKAFIYGAESWVRPRSIVGKAEYSSDGANPRFIETNLDGDPQILYDEVYALEAIWKIASKSNNYTSLLIELRAMNGIQISSACYWHLWHTSFLNILEKEL